MIPTERRNKIAELVRMKGSLSLQEIASTLHVSLITVRRDIKQLKDLGVLSSVFGGVKAVDRILSEPQREYFAKRAIPQKLAIASLAKNYVIPNSCIYLDSGTTTYAIAELLLDRSDITVITNDLAITDLLLRNSKCKIILTGGLVSRDNSSCIGESARKTLLSYNIDVAFISTTSWNERGIATSAEQKITAKRALVECSQKRILVCDSLKFGTIATYVALPPNGCPPTPRC